MRIYEMNILYGCVCIEDIVDWQTLVIRQMFQAITKNQFKDSPYPLSMYALHIPITECTFQRRWWHVALSCCNYNWKYNTRNLGTIIHIIEVFN